MTSHFLLTSGSGRWRSSRSKQCSTRENVLQTARFQTHSSHTHFSVCFSFSAFAPISLKILSEHQQKVPFLLALGRAIVCTLVRVTLLPVCLYRLPLPGEEVSPSLPLAGPSDSTWLGFGRTLLSSFPFSTFRTVCESWFHHHQRLLFGFFFVYFRLISNIKSTSCSLLPSLFFIISSPF